MSDPLFVDIYAGDLNGKPDIAKLVNAGPPWHGLILKATQGLYYPGSLKTRQWFLNNWPLARSLAKDRYGVNWFRGAYHYLSIAQDAKKQAEFYLQMIQMAGGWGKGDLWPIVDVEDSDNPKDASEQQVIDSVSTWAETIKKNTGRSCVLYGRSYIKDRNITSHMGCDYLWVARYASKLPAETYKDIGWTLDKLMAWQYCGDGESYLAGYPKMSPIGATDISAVTIAGGGTKALEYLKKNLYPAQK